MNGLLAEFSSKCPAAGKGSLKSCLDQGGVTYFDPHGRTETNRYPEEDSVALIEDPDAEGYDTGRIGLKAASSVGGTM
jgi:hypothetical protein